MQWHSEWMHKLNRWEREVAAAEVKDGMTMNDKTSGGQRKRVSFIVVANKLDLLEVEGAQPLEKGSIPGRGRHRPVMGLRWGEYAGR